MTKFQPSETPLASTSGTDWLALTEASRLLGVAPGTLRRWSDAGRVHVFTTPGGHRRFRRSHIERMVADQTLPRPSLASSGLTQRRLLLAYHRPDAERARTMPWVESLDDEAREAFRAHGRRLVGTLLAYLDASDPVNAEHHLVEATAQAAEHGRLLARLGMSLSDSVEAFLSFRRPFLDQLTLVTVQRGFDTATTTRLLESAGRAMDRLLLAVLTAHRVAQLGSARRSGTPHIAKAQATADA